jgi:MFS family permease
MNTTGQATDFGAKDGKKPAIETPSGQVCIANISPRERRRRLVGGVIGLAISLGILAALILAGAPHWWRIGLVLPFWGAAVGFFQWRDKT